MTHPTEHEDLEERFQIATDVEFSLFDGKFEGLKPLEIKIKKKQEKKTKIENVELRKSSSKGSLF